MKKIIGALLIGMIWMGGGCAHYNITLNNNNVISTRGRPQYDKATDTYRFKDSLGKPGMVPAFRVKEISPQ